MADRRDVPRVVVALHLRPGLPGRAHRAGARAGAGLLLVRRARVRQEGPGASRAARRGARRRRVAVPQAGLQEAASGRRSARTTGARACVDGRVRLPQPSRLRGRPRVRAAPARRCNTGKHFSETKPTVCWQLPLRAVDREEEDESMTTILTEFGRDGWGEGGEEFGWWCTEAPEAFTGARARLQVDGARAAADARRRRLRAGRQVLRRAALERAAADAAPGRGARCQLGRTRIRRP